MEENKDISSQIDRYLLGQMSEAERLAFEDQLEKDAALKAELTMQEDLAKGIRLGQNRQMKAHLQEMHQEVIGTKNKTRIRPLWKYALSAAACLLLFLVVYQNWPKQVESSQMLYAEFYESYPLNLVNRDGTTAPILLQIDALYQNRQYREVLDLMERRIDSLQQNTTPNSPLTAELSKLYLGAGASYLELKEPQKAQPFFQSIIDKNDPFFKDQARWYLALSLLRQDQIQACRQELQALANDPQADRHQAAKAMLERLP